jgi:hypothetical protein
VLLVIFVEYKQIGYWNFFRLNSGLHTPHSSPILYESRAYIFIWKETHSPPPRNSGQAMKLVLIFPQLSTVVYYHTLHSIDTSLAT